MSMLEPQVFLTPGAIGAAIETTVANIDSPTELNTLGTSQGELRIARTTGAGDSLETLYYLDTTSSAQDLPYIVTSATTGLKWLAMAGYARNQILKLKAISASTVVSTLGNTNAFAEINNQNLNSGASASSDVVATADNGSSTTHYVDLGINGSTGGAAPFTTANGAYLYTTDNQLDISAQGATGIINMSAGATPTILAVFDITNGVTFNDNTTASKQMRLQIANQTAATIFTFDTGAQTVSRTLSVPVLAGADTIMTLATAQTISGAKTFSTPIGSTSGGTGVNNAGTLTNASNTTITGGGTLALGGFTLTVPATGTPGLLGNAQTWSAANTFSALATFGLASGIGVQVNSTTVDSISSAGGMQITKDVGIGAGAGASVAISIRSAAGNERGLYWQTGFLARWAFVANTAAESGSNAGSDFAIGAYTDAGAAIDAPLTITRAAGGAITITRPIVSSSSILSTSASLGVGYKTGAGLTVTQITSRVTGVTINAVCGAITLVSAAGVVTYQTFTVTNSAVSATDTIIVNQKSGTDLNIILVTNVAAGSFKISFATTGGLTTEQPVFNFAVIKAVTA